MSYQDTHWGGGLNSLQRYSRCILKPQSTGLFHVKHSWELFYTLLVAVLLSISNDSVTTIANKKDAKKKKKNSHVDKMTKKWQKCFVNLRKFLDKLFCQVGPRGSNMKDIMPNLKIIDVKYLICLCIYIYILHLLSTCSYVYSHLVFNIFTSHDRQRVSYFMTIVNQILLYELHFFPTVVVIVAKSQEIDNFYDIDQFVRYILHK